MRHNRAGAQKLLKLFGLFNFLLLVSASSVMAQSFEDFKHSQKEAFTSYRDAKDATFSHYLKSEWQEYRAKESQPLYARPKPKSITPTLANKIKSVGPKVHVEVPKVIEKEHITKKTSSKDINLLFFGQEVGINIDKKMRQIKGLRQLSMKRV